MEYHCAKIIFVRTTLDLFHKKLDVYKLALQLAKETYGISSMLPLDERFGLITQLQRAAISLCSNFAEGASRFTNREKKRFYEIARSSLVEIDPQIEICIILKILDPDDIITLQSYSVSVFKILSKMISNLACP